MKNLDGKKVAQFIQEDVAQKVHDFKKKTGITPCLNVVLVGCDSASQIYVKRKAKTCQSVGMESRILELNADITSADLKKNLSPIIQDPKIHGILVQLPLPPTIHKEEVLSWIPPSKDVDALTPFHQGRLWSSKASVLPCTPHGIMRLIKYYDIPIQKQNVVVVGRSQIVGLPTAKLFLDEGATVTICHSQTLDLKTHTKKADLVVVACGRHHLLNHTYFKKGAVVVDVGIHRVQKNGQKIIQGDVCPDHLENVLEWMSPVPGGVGPMTIALLLENTYTLACQQVLNKNDHA